MTTPTRKRTTSPAFQFYPKDFLTSPKVRRMSMTERGIYITLLSVCWLENGLPNDLSDLAAEVGMPVKQFTRIWLNGKLHQCFVAKGGKLMNDRLDEERKKQADFKRRQSDAAGKRWDKARISQKDATALPPQCQPGNALQSSSSSPISNLQTAVTDTRAPKPAPIARRRNMHAAWESDRGLYVPIDLHARFVGFRGGGPEAEKALTDFYQSVSDTFRGEIDPEMFKFWNARYSERWPSTTPAKDNRPEWVKRAKGALS